MNVKGITLVLEDMMKDCLKKKRNEQSHRFVFVVWYKYLLYSLSFSFSSTTHASKRVSSIDPFSSILYQPGTLLY